MTHFESFDGDAVLAAVFGCCHSWDASQALCGYDSVDRA